LNEWNNRENSDKFHELTYELELSDPLVKFCLFKRLALSAGLI